MATIEATTARKSIKEVILSRLRQRVLARRGPMTLPFELEYRHIYILPTGFGWGFGLMLIFMALGGLNFNNNMALMLVFLLATITQLSMLTAHRNLSGLKIDSMVCEPVFCKETIDFRVYVSSGYERNRFAVEAGFMEPEACHDFELNSRKSFHLKYPAFTRGWQEMPSFRLETRFPLGLFRAWSWIFPQTRCLVYPLPARHAPPLPKTGHGETGEASKGDGDQIHGLREYQPGDSLHRIAWRATARHGKIYSMEMESPREAACELDWDMLQGKDVETRLSILTAWVIAADHKQLSYSLIIPGHRVVSGSGPKHRSNCLELLALFSS